jgi:GTP-binding protein
MTTIELIGQTNRGKSSLFNSLLFQNISITSEEVNTTRDYIRFWGEDFVLTDNMGLDTGLQLEERILNATIILYVVNYGDINDIDYQYFRQLRIHKKPFYLIINKCDEKQNSFPLWQTSGAVNVYFVSTKNNYGLKELRSFLSIKNYRENDDEVNNPIPEKINKNNNMHMYDKKNIAIIGGVNSGKSSLLNLLAGYKRSKVSDVAATTRDVVAEEIGDYFFFDTAGFNHIDKKIEKIAINRTTELIKNVDLCIIVIDVIISFSQWNKWLWQTCEKYGKGIIFLFNKSDLLKTEQIDRKYLLETWRIKPYLPYIFFSTLHDDQIPKLMATIKDVLKSTQVRITKSKMDFFLKHIQLPTNNNFINITQRSIEPQIFDIYTKKDLIKNYKQYLENQLITFFRLKGIKPICNYKLLKFHKYPHKPSKKKKFK